MERNCLRDKFSRFSRIFAKFVKLNSRKKKFVFFRFLELAKLAFLYEVPYQLKMVTSIIFYRISHNRELSLLYPNNAL